MPSADTSALRHVGLYPRAVITVAGYSPSVDVTYLVDSFALGQIHRPTDVVRCAGGKALNMARAAATIGTPTSVVAVLGGQSGFWVRQSLDADGIEVTVVASPAETRTCVSIAAADADQLTEIYEHATEISEPVWHQFAEQLTASCATHSGWLSISGSAPKGLPANAIAGLVATASGLGIRTAVDTHGLALSDAIAAGPALVKINRAEAAELLAKPLDSDLATMAAAIREQTDQMVVLTDGREGAVGMSAESCLHAVAPDINGRYPVGSGDAFLGGLLATLDSGADLAEALRIGTACGVANALVPGAGQFAASSVAAIAPKVQLTSL